MKTVLLRSSDPIWKFHLEVVSRGTCLSRIAACRALLVPHTFVWRSSLLSSSLRRTVQADV
jgi:hypothetical protein